MAKAYSVGATVTMTDGTEHEVRAIHPDLVRAEQYLNRHGLPSAQDAPLTWLGVVCWAALRRQANADPAGVDVPEKYQDWEAQVVDIDTAADEAAPDPTRPATD